MKTKTRDGREMTGVKVDASGRERRLVLADSLKVQRRDDSTETDDNGIPRNDDGSIPFYGHAAIFDSPTIIHGWWRDWEETIARGAFKKTINEADVRFLQNHDANLVLARNKSGTLRLAEDDVGLETDADMGPTTYAENLAICINRGDITQMSFAFEVIKEEWTFDEDAELDKRKIIEVKLWDVAAVTYPAFTDTDAALRGLGFEKLCASMDLDREARTKLLRSLTSGEVEPDLVPTLEAAGKALQRMARSNEPAESHSVEALKLRHQALSKRIGLPA